ncbi:MAG: SLBB domain-containing protein [Paludibacter sp.]|nr:SLBB domain-containing protein [Paludibacter sp.]
MRSTKFGLIALLLMLTASITAQDLSKLTPDQLEMYKKYTAGKSATTTTQTTPEKEPEALTRTVDPKDSTLIVPKKIIKPDEDKLTVFGMYLFNDEKLTFEPNLNIPTPQNYIIGTLDEIIVDISGQYEANYKLKVSSEGKIRIPNVGPISVSGQTIAAATRSIKNQVSSIFPGINSGTTRLNVSLGNIRSIRVTIVGEAVRPGTYTLPSLATAFNALYACGGPTETGTMRNIKVIRSGKVVATLDAYSLLVDGVKTNNIVLQDEDIIRIDPYKIRAIVTGAIKHEGIFEGLQGETVEKMIQFAGGFSDNAYKGKITVFRYTNRERTVIDVEKTTFNSFTLVSGDSINVGKTMDRFDNLIEIEGSVVRPGSYALVPGLTVKQLISNAGGLKEDAFLTIAFISRKQQNDVPENIGFNLKELLDDKLKDILLQKYDTVKIKSLFDYREEKTVSILGSVLEPGTYPLKESTKIKDLIFLAGGFKETASKDTIELVRIIKDPSILRNTNEKSTVQKFALDKDQNVLNGGDSVTIQNGDQLIIRNISGYEDLRTIRVEGEVNYPGSYNIKNKAELISDVINRAGGFSKYAYKAGAFLIRSERPNEIEQKLNNSIIENSKSQLENDANKTLDANMLKASGATTVQGYTAMDSIQKKLSGSKVVDKIFKTEGIVGLNMEEVMKNPGGKFDLRLEENDVIYIPREQQTVKVLGQVLFPTIIRYDEKMNLREYIRNSGGFAINANRHKVFVLYANGNACSTKSFLGFKIYPKIEPGSRIVVPDKPIEIKNKLTTAETVAILTSISSSIALIYSILISSL